MENDMTELSKNEVEELFDDIEEIDDTNTENDLGDVELKPYDLMIQDRIVLTRMPALEMINEKFAKQAWSRLFNMMKTSSNMDFKGIEILKYSDYMKSLEMPTCINSIRATPLKGDALVVIDAVLILKMVDIYFGGLGRYAKTEAREFTVTEQRFIMKVLDELFIALKKSWSSIADLEFEFDSMEVNPQMASTISSDEIMVINKFNLQIGTFSGDISLALPYQMLEPVKELLIHGHKASEEKDDRWYSAFTKGVSEANVSLDLKMAEKEMSLKELLKLNKGDIIPIKLNDELTMAVGSVPRYRGKLGTRQGNLAFRISDIITIEHID
jgi:flagellar motor switch protein FliM